MDTGWLAGNRMIALLGRRIDAVSGGRREPGRTFPLDDIDRVLQTVRQGDVVLVEGRGRVSRAIKLLTRSPWSHAIIYVGDALLAREPARRAALVEKFGDGAGQLIVEALIEEGVVANPLAKYRDCHLRICRPRGIPAADLEAVIESVLNDLGKRYDRRNILHLAIESLLPLSFGPFRRKSVEICLGACSEFQVICSGFIARAFQRVGFLVRPVTGVAGERGPGQGGGQGAAQGGAQGGRQGDGRRARPLLTMQHPSHITPRDFDLSPYFEIIKVRARRVRRRAGSQPGVELEQLARGDLDAVGHR